MSRKSAVPKHTVALLVALVWVGACDKPPLPTEPAVPIDPVLPPEGPPPLPQAIACQADVAAAVVTCQNPTADPMPGLSSVILGGQDTLVRLASGNVSYDGSLAFQADVTVQNLIGQPIGTTDGTSVDARGVRVFFHRGPVVTNGSGDVTVANASGTATFIQAEQPYFQYDEMLNTGETSAPLTWRWNVPSSVSTFEFDVYVAADVQYPDGWVEISPLVRWLAPNATMQLNAVSKDVLGREVQRQLTWRSLDESRATVNEVGLVAGVDYGTVLIVAESDGPEASGLAGVIVDGFSGSWASVSAGRDRNTCALDSNGKAYCWGYGAFGQLGTGSTASYMRPVPVWTDPDFSSAGLGIRRFANVSTAIAHTCAVTPSGRAFCWGLNSSGELGSGSTDAAVVPVPVVGNLTFAEVSAGDDHTCGLHVTGAALCWGLNNDGQLGTGQGAGYATAPQLVSGDLSFEAISAGGFHSCAVTTGGEPYCWGANQDGQLGIGEITFWERVPRSVITDLVSPAAPFASVSAGSLYTCGLTTTDDAYCWGYNGPWIGHPWQVIPPNAYLVPVSVQGGLSFVTVSAAETHTCAVATGGEAYCWGENFHGEIGDGTTTYRYSPTPVSGGLSFLSVSASEWHSCGVTVAGDLYCWGFATWGRLGNLDDRPVAYLTPQQVADPLSDNEFWNLSGDGSPALHRLHPWVGEDGPTPSRSR